jgi:hypothetical protein
MDSPDGVLSRSFAYVYLLQFMTLIFVNVTPFLYDTDIWSRCALTASLALVYHGVLTVGESLVD